MVWYGENLTKGERRCLREMDFNKWYYEGQKGEVLKRLVEKGRVVKRIGSWTHKPIYRKLTIKEYLGIAKT